MNTSNVIIKSAVTDMSMYNTKTFELEDVLKDESYKNDDNVSIHIFYWYPNQELIKRLERHLFRKNITDKIIDAGRGNAPFPSSTHILDKDTKGNSDKIAIKFDLNFILLNNQNQALNIFGQSEAFQRDLYRAIRVIKHINNK